MYRFFLLVNACECLLIPEIFCAFSISFILMEMGGGPGWISVQFVSFSFDFPLATSFILLN